MVKIYSQVAFFCLLTASILNSGRVEWIESIYKCYLWHLKPNFNYLETIGMVNKAT